MTATGTAATRTDIAARAVAATKIYGAGQTAVRALDGVDVEFARHRYTAIMGPSGSGKSTLLHCMAGLDRVTSGQIFLGDTEISATSEKHLTLIRRDQIGFVFQAYNLIPTLTAEENITLPIALAGRKPDPARFDQVIDTVHLARPAPPQAQRALRRSATARRGGACPPQPARDRVRRRAHREPRLQVECRDPRVHAPGRRRPRPDDRDGHPRPRSRRATPIVSSSSPTARSSARSSNRRPTRSSTR